MDFARRCWLSSLSPSLWKYKVNEDKLCIVHKLEVQMQHKAESNVHMSTVKPAIYTDINIGTNMIINALSIHHDNQYKLLMSVLTWSLILILQKNNSQFNLKNNFCLFLIASILYFNWYFSIIKLKVMTGSISKVLYLPGHVLPFCSNSLWPLEASKHSESCLY